MSAGQVVRLAIITLFIIVIFSYVRSWSQKRQHVQSSNMLTFLSRRESEIIFMETASTSVVELYRRVKKAFYDDYAISIGYKYRDGVLTWEFNFKAQKMDFEHWKTVYKGVFPAGHDFVLPPLERGEYLDHISIDVDDDTYTLGFVSHLNIYLTMSDMPGVERTLSSDGSFTLQGKYVQDVTLATRRGFTSPEVTTKLASWLTHVKWNGKSYTFYTRGEGLGLHVMAPDPHTLTSYFAIFHPNVILSPRLMSSIVRISVHFDNPNVEIPSQHTLWMNV